MTDIALQFDPKHFVADIFMDGSDLASDEGLQTAVVLSLFLDRRAETDDELPEGGDRRGWWADAYPDVENDRIGSRLWLLSREKQLNQVLIRAREYAAEALQWLIDDGVAEAVEIDAYIPVRGVLRLGVIIERAGGGRWQQQWEYQIHAL